ncbi:MAG: MotA/TolQ/ExbB proton channel family protein [Gemmatimonadota bacterium]
MNPGLGLLHFWSQADAVIRLTGYLLLLMSVASWSAILWKTWAWWRARRAAGALEQFWAARSMDEAVALLKPIDTEAIFVPLATSAASAAAPPSGAQSLAAQIDRSELITRALRQRINEAAARLEAGLTFLASVGSTAPFVGLFGTVWGIYHALLNIAASGSVAIDKVAGPVGEALVMTAFGLAVAVPALLGYNAFTRVNRMLLAQLDGFAHDLHAFLTVGARFESE